MDDVLARGIRLFNGREVFACHETLEEAWTPERGPRRLFLQALIHVAVGFYHHQRSNSEGARRQLYKRLRKLNAFLPSCEVVDKARLFRETTTLFEQIKAGAALPSAYPQIHRSSDLGS